MIHFRSRDTTVCLPVRLYIYLSVRCHREEKRTEDLLITRNEILVIIIIIIIIIIFLTRFLRDAWMDFHEIFRDGRY